MTSPHALARSAPETAGAPRTTTAPRPTAGPATRPTATVRPSGAGHARHHRDTDPRVDVPALTDVLLGRYADLRRGARDLVAEPRFQKVEGLPAAEHRARVLEQLRALEAEGDVLRAFPSALGGADDHGGYLARFEELVVADPSLQIKAGVQWGLFASAILHLGTAGHHERLLPGAMSVAVPGAFAMTETGHGSDVASIGTTATYDPATEEFVVHTPFRAAWKDYLGNAGQHGTAAVVFAQLVSQGPADPRPVNHGVHAFYVPIRDAATGEFLPGVGGEDDGLKGGLNGIDNGRLWFDHVRVPRADLLDRYGSVAADGTYSSPIASPGRRFFTMLGTLVQGRVSLDGAAVNAAKIGLVIAVTYGNQRRQFAGASPTDEVVLLDYGEHRRRLLPLLAETYAATFAHEHLLAAFDDVFSGRDDTPDSREELETLAAALKPTSTWHALRTLQTAREACGGAGFLTANRLTSLRADLDVYVTFEGDNTVLYQLVGKRLLARYGQQIGGDPAVIARLVAGRAADAALHRMPLARAAQTLVDAGDARRSAGQLRDPHTQRDLLADRVAAMVAELAQALRPARRAAPEVAAQLFDAHQHELVEAARAHAELLQWEAFTRALDTVADAGTRQVLTWLRDLFGLTVIERNLAWYLVNGRLSAGRARTVTSYIERLLLRLRPHAQDLVDAFGYGPEHVRAEIASGAEAARQDEAREAQRAARASGTDPVPEPKPAR
ncbi:acyl-CoA dehydrogenase [Cellulomonas hominis]|uniref:acyl-CoA oxidase n=1 Tax=Cellulomonas hominis TaxID=156981 RepID=A0A511FAF1_9CELL|nr:acyl-CoA dehydrogenase [Cellulomonas hominis]MBB5473481.1 acyl-CoA oxidase [Cellulomonas hominis]GEL45237.1 acyl-CoA dehydrogenase [Cellulomonas hominis]